MCLTAGSSQAACHTHRYVCHWHCSQWMPSSSALLMRGAVICSLRISGKDLGCTLRTPRSPRLCPASVVFLHVVLHQVLKASVASLWICFVSVLHLLASLKGQLPIRAYVCVCVYVQLHYPFENKKLFEEGFPADFVAEGVDQTRGWWVTQTHTHTSAHTTYARTHECMHARVRKRANKARTCTHMHKHSNAKYECAWQA